jgi:hypothetical protein
MKALTVWRPWSSLIAAGVKPYEFRGWRAPKNIIGQTIAIYAGSRGVRRNEIDNLLLRLLGPTAWMTGLKPDAIPLLERWRKDLGILPLSSIVCTAILGEPVSAGTIVHEFGGPVNDGEHSNWAWPMLNPQPMEPIVPARGAQGLWEWKA